MPRKLLFLFAIALCVPAALVGQTEVERAWTILDQGVADPRDGTREQAVQRQLQTFARELVSSLQFYQSQADSLGIREVVLAGGTAKLGGLAGCLEPGAASTSPAW